MRENDESTEGPVGAIVMGGWSVVATGSTIYYADGGSSQFVPLAIASVSALGAGFLGAAQKYEPSEAFSSLTLCASIFSLLITAQAKEEKLKNAVPLPEPIAQAVKDGQITKKEITKKFAELCEAAKIKVIKIEAANTDICAAFLEQEPK